MRHVIIGASAAGIAAAKTIRKMKPDDEILMLSADKSVHSRCMLHKYISHERDEAAIRFIDSDFFEENNIQWIGGIQVTSIDTQIKRVNTEDSAYTYDRLLIATGANSVIPPVGDLQTAKNVYGLRHLSDAQLIDAAAEGAAEIVIIGSGLVGLDAAVSLLERGKNVTIVEMESRIMPLQLDENAASTYQRLFEAHGCKFKLSRKAVSTNMDSGGNITSVVLDSGEALQCDFVIVAAGVRPAVQSLEGSGISCDRAITVDNHMRTNITGVYAAGDVTGLSGIWPNAVKQGETAGRNMCGMIDSYTDTYAVKNTANFYGLQTLSLGETMAKDGDTVFIREDRNRYHKIILRDGTVVGVLFQGIIDNSGIWQYIIKNQIHVEDINKPVWDITFADFYGVLENGEYQWAVE